MDLKYKYFLNINKKFYSNYKIKDSNLKDHFFIKGYENGFLSSRKQFLK